MNFKLNYKQYSDYINISHGVFSPLKSFVNKKQFNSILKNQLLNKKFFPLPIFFGINKQQYFNIKDKKKLTLNYKNKNIAEVANLNIYDIDKELFGRKVFGKKYKKHPYFEIFNQQNYKFISFKIYKKYISEYLPRYFVSPTHFKKKNKKFKIFSKLSY